MSKSVRFREGSLKKDLFDSKSAENS